MISPAVDQFQVIISEQAINERVKDLGRRLAEDYKGKDPLFVGVLRGAVLFLSDLIRATEIPLAIDFIAVSSYGASTKSSGVVRILKDLDEDIEGRHVVLVEDIVDTGLTLNYLLKNIESRSPASVEICSLLVKGDKQMVPVELKYVGFEIADDFVIGYGLDYAERYRNLPFISLLPADQGLAAR